jgi:hypothetical protein
MTDDDEQATALVGLRVPAGVISGWSLFSGPPTTKLANPCYSISRHASSQDLDILLWISEDFMSIV